MGTADVAIAIGPHPWLLSTGGLKLPVLLQGNRDELRGEIKRRIPNRLVQHNTAAFSRHRAMERANGNLQRSHGSNQMNHMVRLIPVGINQRVNTTAFQHQVVINLVAVNIILLAMIIIRG